MNLKLSSSLLGICALTGTMMLGVGSASAQIAPGAASGNGSTFTNNNQFIYGRGTSNTSSSVSPKAQAAVNQVSQTLTANNVGQPVFSALTGSPEALASELVPAGVAPNGPTASAAAAVASSMPGLRDGSGNINIDKLGSAVDAYNNYVAALVGEVGGDKAIALLADAQKSGGKGSAQTPVQSVLTQLVQAAQSN
jgi:hypothetical protein